jgi:hypothetical protein
MNVKKRVARGVALMDEVKPGWDRRINLARLDIGCANNCIVGQVFGHFNKGSVEHHLGLRYRETPRYGFAGRLRTFGEKKMFAEWEELTREWARVVMERRWTREVEKLEREHRALLASGKRMVNA